MAADREQQLVLTGSDPVRGCLFGAPSLELS
jgi:hypothetical protein